MTSLNLMNIVVGLAQVKKIKKQENQEKVWLKKGNWQLRKKT